MRLAAPVLLALALAAPAALAQASASPGAAPAVVEARVLVVVFDASGSIDAGRLQGLLEPLEARVGPAVYRVSFEVRSAPPWAVEGLREGLEALYERRGPPPWAPSGWEPPGGYAWLPVEDSLEAVWEWAVRAAGDPGSLGYYSLAVVIGDLDGASRVYTAPGGLAGLRAWAAGDRPLWLLDLSAAPAPLSGCGGGPVGEPLWLSRDPTLDAARALEAHARGHVAGPARPLPPGAWLRAVVVPLSGVEPRINVDVVEDALGRLAPWAGVRVSLAYREPPRWLEEAYRMAARMEPGGGPVKLMPATLASYASIIASDEAARCPGRCAGVAVILAAPRPLELEPTWGPGWAVLALPWGNASSEAAVVHALALAAGLEPPGAAAGWSLADQAPSPASCIPGAVEAYMEEGSYYDTARLAAATAAALAGEYAEALRLLEGGQPLAAVLAALNPAKPPGRAGEPAGAVAVTRGGAAAGWAAEAHPQAGREPAPVNEAAPVNGRPAPGGLETPGEPESVWAWALAAFLATAWLGVAGLAVARLAGRTRGAG